MCCLLAIQLFANGRGQSTTGHIKKAHRTKDVQVRTCRYGRLRTPTNQHQFSVQRWRSQAKAAWLVIYGCSWRCSSEVIYLVDISYIRYTTVQAQLVVSGRAKNYDTDVGLHHQVTLPARGVIFCLHGDHLTTEAQCVLGSTGVECRETPVPCRVPGAGAASE